MDDEITEENGNPGLAILAGGIAVSLIDKTDQADWIKAAAGDGAA